MEDKVVDELLREEAAREEELAADPVVEELKSTKDQLLRLAADFDNYRKRCAKERDEIALRAKCDVLKAFLPVADNFERAVGAEASLEDYRRGVRMICEQLAGVLSDQGAACFGAPGDAFDPTLHHAVAHKEEPGQEAHVVDEVYSKGWRVSDRVIREAVVVTKG